MDSMTGIVFVSKLPIYDRGAVVEFGDFCKDNGIDFENIEIRCGIEASALGHIFELVFSNEFLLSVVSGVIAATVVEGIKFAIIKLIKANTKTKLITKPKPFEEISLTSDSASLQIKKESIPDEVLTKALDAFITVSTIETEKLAIPTYVVVGKDEIEVLSQLEFVKKYYMSKVSDEDLG